MILILEDTKVRTAPVVLVVLLAVACGKSEPPAAAPTPTPVTTATEAPEILWRSDLQPCTQGACGNVDVNSGWMSIQSGEITVAKDGSLAVQMERFSNASSTPGANRTLEIWFGNFSSGGFAGGGFANPVGSFTTDSRGNYNGPVVSSNGPVKLQRGTGFSGVFIVNEPGVRSLFVTEYIYKD
jgi:hypothetical protein